VSVVTSVSVDGKDLAEVLKGLQEQLDTQKQLSEKLEARCGSVSSKPCCAHAPTAKNGFGCWSGPVTCSAAYPPRRK
jgi:hypothetical protein